MQDDKEGFEYPAIDNNKCIKCGLCEKVCPIINKGNKRSPLHVYAAKNSNENVRQHSSSGGVFSLLAEQVIREGGVVFGVKYNVDADAVFSYFEDIGSIDLFRGSKYVQAKVGYAYREAEVFLKSGRKVMFAGTPCQILGLKLFLRKQYSNLLAVDVVCHGVPSPMVWRRYIKEEAESMGVPMLYDINCRDKYSGWKRYSFSYQYTDGNNNVKVCARFDENIYMKAFLSNLTLRPSCYSCPVRAGRSMSDITIGDFWGIDRLYPEFDDDKGISLVMVYNSLSLPECDFIEVSYDDAIQGNYCIEKSVSSPIASRYRFFRVLNRKNSFKEASYTILSKNLIYKLFRLLDKLLHRIFSK
jgi:coenzyme F420-reducing hydrogenase beta subunit